MNNEEENTIINFNYNNNKYSIKIFFSLGYMEFFLKSCEDTKDYEESFKKTIYEIYKETENNNIIDIIDFKNLDENIFIKCLDVIINNDEDLKNKYNEIKEDKLYKKLYLAINKLIREFNTKTKEYIPTLTIPSIANFTDSITSSIKLNQSMMTSAMESLKNVAETITYNTDYIKGIAEASRQAVEYMQNILPPSIEILQNNLKNIVDSIKFNLPSEEYFDEIYKKMAKIASKCGKAQWTLPTNIDMNILYDISSHNYSKRKLDNIFMDFFMSKNQSELKETLSNIKSSMYIRDYIKIFNQACYNFKKKKYYSSLIVLITIYEGIISNLSADKSGINIQRKINGICTKISTEQTGLILADVSGIKNFNDKLYDGVDFNNITPNKKFNRNVIMHGRVIDNIGKIEVIKMLNALDTLIKILSYIEE